VGYNNIFARAADSYMVLIIILLFDPAECALKKGWFLLAVIQRQKKKLAA
jgi:hypothetical protein